MITKRSTAAGAVALAGAFLVAASTASASVQSQCGNASWYALYSQTASGEQMNPAELTAAHRTLPFGTKLKVTNQRNGKSVIVRINDRGPVHQGARDRPVQGRGEAARLHQRGCDQYLHGQGLRIEGRP